MVTPEGARKLADYFDEAKKFGTANVLRDIADQVKALQADAERYRWLKKSCWYVGPTPECDDPVSESYDENYGNNLDSAIESAMKS